MTHKKVFASLGATGRETPVAALPGIGHVAKGEIDVESPWTPAASCPIHVQGHPRRAPSNRRFRSDINST